MDFALPEELLDLKRRVCAFVEQELLPLEEECEANDDIAPERWWELRRKAASLGLTSFSFPRSVGGAGLGQLGEVVAFEELTRVGHGLASVVPYPSPILMACTGEQRERFLYPCIRGEKVDSFALTEYGAGSDARGIRTSAVRTSDGWLINGIKRFAGNGDRADFVIVFALAGGQADQVTAFLVETSTPGFRVLRRYRMMGLRGMHVTELAFEDCLVPHDNVLGDIGKGFELARDWLTNGRILVGATALGMGERVLALAREHALRREQFGQPIADFQAIQFMLADSAVDLMATRALTYDAAATADRGDDRRAAHLKAAMAKLYGSEALWRITDRAVQILGASGYVSGSFVERAYRNARIERIWDGTSEIQRGVIARAVLKHGLKAWGPEWDRDALLASA